MPATWACGNCGFSDTFKNLRETPVKNVPYQNPIPYGARFYHIFALEDELVEKRPNDRIDALALKFRCPKCGNEESE